MRAESQPRAQRVLPGPGSVGGGVQLGLRQGVLYGRGRCGVGGGRRGGRVGGGGGSGRGGELWHLGIVGAGHADHLGVGAAAANLDPVVLKELDGDFAVGEELDVVVKLAGGNGAGAGLFDFDRSTGANGLVEIGGGDVQAVALGLDEKVGQNRDGGFALYDGLRCSEFLDQVLTAYRDFHCCPLRRGVTGWLVHFGFHTWHETASALGNADFRYGHNLQQEPAMREIAVFSTS